MLIRTRLILIGLLPLLLLLLFVAWVMATQRQLDSFREKVAIADNLGKNIFALIIVEHDLVGSKSDRPRQQWPSIMQKIEPQLPIVREIFSSTDESELSGILIEHLINSQRDFRELEQWLDQHQGMMLNTVQQDYRARLSKRLHIELQSAMPIASRIAAINQEQAAAFAERRSNAMIAALLFIASMILLLLWPLIRGITRSVNHLKAGMNQVALGDLELRIAVTGKDEITQLALHFNEMTAKLAEVTVARETLSAEVIERKRAEKALKDSEQRFRDIVNSTDGIVWEADASTFNFTFISQQAERLLGYPLEDWLQPGFWVEHLHPDDKEWASKYCASCTHRLEQHDFEYRFIAGDGRTVWLRDLVAVVVEDGMPRWLRGIMLDITERKLSEEKLLKSDANMRAILDNMPYLAWLKDAAGRYIAVNDAFIKTTVQKRVQDVLGKTDLDLWPKELAEKYRADDAEVMALQQQKYIEEPALGGDRTFWVETFKTPVIDKNGNVLGTTGLSRDITERKEYEDELKRSNIELEQFSYAISHDMRQPLRMISSYLQLLEMGLSGQLDSEKRDYFNFAIEGAKRIDQMLVGLLEYSRVGRVGEPLAWIESRAALDEVMQFLQPALAEAQAKVNISGDWPRIYASGDEIMRLIQNLIGNALKFRVAGRIPEITVTGEMAGNEWHVCVADNGVGIIPDQIKRLFQVFQRLQLRTAYEGNGIGLALCRKIAEHHGGRIWAGSAGEGRGSKFCVALPVPRERQHQQREKT